ncbi:flagellar biosynthesis anti-sigma factor FlgM [Nitrincola sp. MINF-07-Sa-05]|uniref:flagellar biosynthesis anti-sigma factor FlgM n=1 Tax=Nitrincola salilacus TaxID=3400273 RepID=UPI0039180CAF
MAIDLNGLSSNQTTAARGKSAEQQRNSPVAEKSENSTLNQPASDTVKLSDAAQALQEAGKRLDTAPDVDAERIASIKAAIADGSYQVDSGRIANKMLQFDKLFN